MIALQKQQESRNTSVSITEWVYAKKIQIKCRHENKGWDLAFFDGVVVELHQFLRADRRICNGNRLEANPREDCRVNNSCLPRASPRSARYQEVDAGIDSNLRAKSLKVIIAFPFHKTLDPPAPAWVLSLR
jgi:hypothetical protein